MFEPTDTRPHSDNKPTGDKPKPNGNGPGNYYHLLIFISFL